MHALLFIMLTAGIWQPLFALLTAAGFFVFGTFAHSGSFDQSAQIDVCASQSNANIVALVANSVLAAGLLTGALDIMLINTANAPGTQTTRTAAQLYADLVAEFGFQPPPNFQFFLTIAHGGTGTLTLAGGTGVSITSLLGGATTVATGTSRMYIVTVVNAATINIQTMGSFAT
jgi:hypothetical protein